jgi:hypothetical protein
MNQYGSMAYRNFMRSYLRDLGMSGKVIEECLAYTGLGIEPGSAFQPETRALLRKHGFSLSV